MTGSEVLAGRASDTRNPYFGADATESMTLAAEPSSTLTLVPLAGNWLSMAAEGKRPSILSKAAT